MSKEFVDGKGKRLYDGYDTDEIVANPELDGTEVPLTSLKLGDDKYKIESDSAYYEVKESDITITGTSSPYPITMSSELETAVLSGKRALFVNGTMMNILTSGEITTDTLFNIISYDKLTQSGYKHIIAFSTYTSLFGIVTVSAIFMQDDNNQWYIIDGNANIDTDYLQQQIIDLDNRVQALENSGSELYEHNIKVVRGASSARWEIELRLITTDAQAFLNATSFNNWLYSNYAQGNYISATGRYAEQVSGTYSYSTIINVFYSGTSLNATVLTTDFANSIVNLETKILNLSSSAITLYDVVRQIS